MDIGSFAGCEIHWFEGVSTFILFHLFGGLLSFRECPWAHCFARGSVLDFRVGYASMRNVPMLGNYLFTCFVCFSPYFILYKRDPMYRSYPSVCLPLLLSSPRQTLMNVADLILTQTDATLAVGQSQIHTHLGFDRHPLTTTCCRACH